MKLIGIENQIQIQIKMDSKRRSSTPKSNKQQSHSKPKSKRGSSPGVKESKSKQVSDLHTITAGCRKKTDKHLVKKKIEDLKTPEILIKVSYKNKRITIPIVTCDDKSLHDTVMPHIVRFEHQVLQNPEFQSSSICNWKSTGRPDILRDYYFQTNKPISTFKGQLLEIQPIWRQKGFENICLNDFEIIKCIGTGGFSRVFLARLRSTGVFYALKLMEKEGLFESGKDCVVTNERNIMVGLSSPYIVNLEFAFETKHFVVLALEYCPGGELFYYLRRVKRMSEDDARYCFLQILLGIQYLHNQNIIYRDIKPENIMIDANGNLKIADFGLSKEGIRGNDLATTYCGSPEYMAPEMLSKTGHNYSVDYYCMGALLYQLVTGNPPFYSRDVQKIYYSIQNEDIDFPPHINLSPQIKMLLEGLLIKDPRRRLGSMGGVRQILGHPWVRKLKVADILNKNVETPIHIDLLTFNINEEEIEEGGEEFILKLRDEGGMFEKQFDDFYFNRYEEVNVLDEALPSVKSDSTKENKSMKVPQSSAKKVPRKNIQEPKTSLSRQKFGQFNIKVEHTAQHPTSQARGLKEKKLKKKNSHKQVNLIERAKKREEKSVLRQLERQKSPNLLMKRSSTNLKRIKSNAALHTMFKKAH